MFTEAPHCLAERIPLPYLGVLPFSPQLQPESEDSLCREAEERGDGDTVGWIRFPHLSNSQDCQPWLMDSGVRLRWIQHAHDLDTAKIVILPGTKNTLADLRWLYETGIDQGIIRAAGAVFLSSGFVGDIKCSASQCTIARESPATKVSRRD